MRCFLFIPIFLAVSAHAQINFAVDFPCYDFSYSLERAGNKVNTYSNNLNLGQIGLHFGDRITLSFGGKVLFMMTDYSYHRNYFEERRESIPGIRVYEKYPTTWGLGSPNLQLRYYLRNSFIGPVELGIGRSWRYNASNFYTTYGFREPFTDSITGNQAYRRIDEYHISGDWRWISTYSIHLRKYLNTNRIQFYIEPYCNLTQVSLRLQSRSIQERWSATTESHLGYKWIPEVGLKVSARWERHIGVFSNIKAFFTPIE